MAAAFVAALWAAGCGGGGDGATEGAATGKVPDETTTATTTPGVPASGPTAVGPTAPSGTVIQAQETNEAGLVAELTEATRKEGVLTVKVRFRNTGAGSVYNAFGGYNLGGYSGFYVTAGDQKFFVLNDAEGAPLAPSSLVVSLDAGETMNWWAKFPAPPATETTFDLIMPDVTPFEDVPITDR